jgi:lysophospholipid acyltransferase (LPLAT)-like uncharacterized protein
VGDIETLKRSIYGLDDLAGYKFGDRVLIRFASSVLFVIIWIVCRTARWDVRGMEHLETIRQSRHQVIYTFWHTCIFTATWFWRNRGIVVMSSPSRDGEFTGRIIKRFGYGTARGSSSRKAGRALAEMATCLENGIDVAFTIDGPRGPAFEAKTGAVTLARHTGQAILPFHITPARFFELPTWDRMRVPWPFSRVRVGIGPPVYVPRDASEEVIASRQAEVQSSLDSLRKSIESTESGESIES